ncbi:hypothetical protein ABTG60_16260, partial [Acinetobacter baumannii]
QALFKRASLLQHLMVPRTGDTICPFIPLQVGGDDGFPHSPEFLEAVVRAKSRDQREVRFRLDALLKGKWGYRLVRNANLNNVVHRYHTLVPKLRELKELIPPEAVIEGNQLLLNSIKISGVESPERTFFRIWNAWYWDQVLQGRTPPEMRLEVNKASNVPHTYVVLPYREFWETWRSLGFTFENVPEYLVETKKVHVTDYMNMGWKTGLTPIMTPPPSIEDIGGNFLLHEGNLENFISHIRDNTDLDPKVRSNIHKYVESDSYIKWEFSRREDLDSLPKMILLVSSDYKLGAQLARMARAHPRPDGLLPLVGVVNPKYYSYGFMGLFEEEVVAQYGEPPITIVDYGSWTYSRMV